MGRPRIKIMDDSAEGRLPPNAASSRQEAEGKMQPATHVILEEAQRPIESENKDAIASLQHDKTKKPQKPGKAKPRSLSRTKSRGKKYQEVVKDLDRNKTYSLAEAVDMVKKLSYAKFNATLEAHINTAQTGIRGSVSLPYAKGKKSRILVSGPSQPPQLEGKIVGSKKVVESFQDEKTEYETEPKAPIVHVSLGKLNQPNEELVVNIKTLLQTLGKSRIKKVTLSPTMGPGVKVDLTSI